MDFMHKLIIFLLGTSTFTFAQEEKEAEQPAQYSFEYHVNNPETGDVKSQNEIREGDVVHGQYGLVEPDGSVRTVEYTADDQNGFRAVVHKSGGPAEASVAALPKALLPSIPPQDFQETSTDEIPFIPESEIKQEYVQIPSTTKAPEAPKTASVSVTPKSVSTATTTLIPPLAKLNPYVYPYYKYAAHPWTLYNLYKAHPAYRYPLLHPAHPANPLSPLHPANPLHPLHPAHPANPLLSPYSALHPLYNPLYHV